MIRSPIGQPYSTIGIVYSYSAAAGAADGMAQGLSIPFVVSNNPCFSVVRTEGLD